MTSSAINPKLSPEIEALVELLSRGSADPAGPTATADKPPYTRELFLSVLEALWKQGCEIVPPSPSLPPSADKRDLPVQISALGKDLVALRKIWKSHDPQSWKSSIDAYVELGSAFLECGEPLLAFDVLREAMETGGSYRAQQLCAAALLRSGAIDSACKLLEELVDRNPKDEETLGLLARAEKGLAFLSSEAAPRQRHFSRAFALYANAFQTTQGYWTGINAATLALVMNKKGKAKALATEVITHCEQELSKSSQPSFWVFATLGEAHLILGNLDQAAECYRRAIAAGANRYGTMASMRRNAELVLQHGKRQFPLAEILPLPDVIVFSSQVMKFSKPETGFSPQAASIQHEIEDNLGSSPALAYSSATAGAEIIFLETNARNGGENYIVLPFPEKDFVAASVAPAGPEWVDRFSKLLANSAGCYVLSSGPSHALEAQFAYANLMAFGLANLKAQEFGTRIRGLAVQDLRSDPIAADRNAKAVRLWQRHKVQTQVIGQLPATAIAKTRFRRRTRKWSLLGAPQVRAILFADVVGFSRLVESQVVNFFDGFMKTVGKFLDTPARHPLAWNTWGDALYLVYKDARSAGCAALELQSRIANIQWSRFGLPDGMALRIGLHAGPVYSCADPVTKLPTFVGAQVTRAARIEPITPPGKVYVSQEFAAIAAAEGVEEFASEYVGITPSAKGYGDYATYVLHSRS